MRCGVGSFSSESTLEGTRLGTMASARAASLLADALRAVSMDAVLDEPPSDAPTTDSESDWSDAELRESDSHGNGAPPSAAQGMGRPWAHIARARRSRREARARGASMRYQGNDAESRDGAGSNGAGVFLSDLDASAAVHVLACLDPVDRARVTACRRAERAALTHRGHVRVASARSTPRSSVNATPVGSFGGGIHLGASPANGPRFGSGEAQLDGNFGGEGHLADAAWRDVDARGAATPAALATLRNVACGSLVRLDVTGSRGIKRGELLELVRESPRLRDLRVAHLGDTGKFSCGDCELFLAACPSLARFECDVGVSAARVKDKDGVLVPGPAELDLAALLAPGGATVIRRLKIHSADAAAARALAAVAAGAAGEKRGPRVFSLDVSWGLKLACAAAEGVAEACETRGRGFPFARLAMRKANVRCPGAARLALAIRRAADRRERFDRALAYARERKSRGEDGHGDAFADADEMFAVDDEEGAQDVDERARRGSVDFVSADGTSAEPRRPTCRLRWLDLGSNLIGDRGGAALGDALGPRVPITRISLRDNPLGVEACAALGAAAARCPSLRRLDLAHCGFGDAGVAALAAGFMSAPTGRSTGLRVLQLGFNNIGEVGIKALAEAHAAGKLDHLEHLDLACNVLGPKGTAALVPMLEPSRREEARDARGGDAAATSASGGDYEDDSDDSDDSDEDFEDPDANAPSARPRRAGLYSLDIAVNNCSFDGGSTGERFGVKALLAALERNATLRHLNLRGNDLTPEMAGDVAEMLLENQTLRMVNVGYNKIYDEGTWELAEALSENAGIRGLDLQRNEISDAGAAHVRGLLRENTSIAEVDMRSNMLSPEVVSAFGDVFGTRVNCRWQQEPPKMDRSGAPQKRLVADGFGGGVKAKRAAKKAAKENAKRG